MPTVSQAALLAPSGCHGQCSHNATSVTVVIASIEVHTSGIDNATGEWIPVCTSKLPLPLDLVKLADLTQLLCGANITPNTITNVRLQVSSANATISGMGNVKLTLPSGNLEIPISPVADVHAGKTTAIVVDFDPHIVCQGNSGCKLTPGLQATSQGPD